MRSLNRKQDPALPAAIRSPGLKLVAVSAVALTTAFFSAPSAFAETHSPVLRADGPAKLDARMLGEPKGSDVAMAIEEKVMDGRIDATLGTDVSPGAKLAARQAYAQGVFKPLWTRKAAEKLMAANPTCRDNGFDSGFTDEEIRAAIDARFSGDAEARAAGDLRLTATWLVLASKLSGGLSDEGGMVRSTDTRPTRSDLVQALRSAGESDPIEAMERFASLSPQYAKLRDALKQYREHAENGGWMKLRDGDEMLEPGMDDPRVPALRERLAAEGYRTGLSTLPAVMPGMDGRTDFLRPISMDIAPSAPTTLYDGELVEQVKAFQAAHGLARDGVIGPSTLAALNESVESKIDRIQRSMDHWRKTSDLGERHIWVNIPSYRVEGWSGGEREIVMDTIVGKKRTPTTAFSDEIEYIVVNPKWFLPIGLFKRQKLNKLRKDPGYAARKNYMIFDRASGARLDAHTIDWTEPGVSRRIQMVQTPGPHNALGQLKIIFPNKHAIYLHDTPDRHLFERDVRALSSGCVRLKDPVAMANWLTDGDTGVATNVFNATLESQERERFYLDTHVPVHLTYLPAVVSPEGKVEFPADIYREFKEPTLAKGTYPDDIETMSEGDLYVATSGESGPRTEALQ
ncbi:MAG: L,D-transpeptidase family protein [Litorimonas sp.]